MDDDNFEAPGIDAIVDLCVRNSPVVGHVGTKKVDGETVLDLEYFKGRQLKNLSDRDVLEARDYFYPDMRVAKVIICEG